MKVLQNDVEICAGVIVSPKNILTIRVCANEPKARYTIISGAPLISPIQYHNVVDRLHQGRCALHVIRPDIGFASPSLNRQMPLFEGPLPRYIIQAAIISWESHL